MRGCSNLFFAFLVVTGLVVNQSPGASADEGYVQYDGPILMRLGYKKNDEEHEAKVPARLGNAVAPMKGLPQLKLQIKPGSTLAARRRPGNRLVALYLGTKAKNRVLVGIVHVRYFRNKTGHWVPHYRIDQQHLMVRARGRWAPITSVRGNPTMIVLLGNSTPNAFGYYRSLTIGLTTKRIRVDSWFVR